MKILITGGTGTVGKALINQNDSEYISVSRNEEKIAELKREHPEVKFYVGNIEDKGLLLRVFKDIKPDDISHVDKAIWTLMSLLSEINYQAANQNLTVHGNTMVRAGKIVTVKIPYVQASSVKNEEPFDKFYNGPFLIKRIRHDFLMNQSPPKHIMSMNLVKDSLEEELPNPVDNMEPSAPRQGAKINYEYYTS